MFPLARISHSASWLLTVLTVTISIFIAHTQAANLPIIPLGSAPQNAWAKMEKLFIFGDSWSNIGFNWTDVQPSPLSPFGNPVGNYTAADVIAKGARWPVYLTTTYNASLLETYCLAQTGSVVDSGITPHGSDFVHQVNADFLPMYGNASSGNWSAGSTLFLAFFGVNDVNLVLPMANATQNQTLDKIFASYNKTVEQLYQAGARNFVLLNEPPMDLAPNALAGLGPLIVNWNTRLKLLIQSLGSKYHSNTPATSMNIFEFDTNALFTSVIADPASTPQTINIKNTTGWCPAYYDKGIRHGADTYNASCGSGLTLGEYMWLNNIHPTLTMYQAMAAQIAKMFGA